VRAWGRAPSGVREFTDRYLFPTLQARNRRHRRKRLRQQNAISHGGYGSGTIDCPSRQNSHPELWYRGSRVRVPLATLKNKGYGSRTSSVGPKLLKIFKSVPAEGQGFRAAVGTTGRLLSRQNGRGGRSPGERAEAGRRLREAVSRPREPYSTAAKSLPTLSIASASRSLTTTSSGQCFFRRLVVIESLLALRAVDLYVAWIRIFNAGRESVSSYA
jgi:hypothetical protein